MLASTHADKWFTLMLRGSTASRWTTSMEPCPMTYGYGSWMLCRQSSMHDSPRNGAAIRTRFLTIHGDLTLSCVDTNWRCRMN